MDTIMAEHMRVALEVVEQDEELGRLVIGDELDRLAVESLEHWARGGAWSTGIPPVLYKDIALALRRIRRASLRSMDEWPSEE